MRDAHGTLRALGAAVLVITREPPDRARAYARELALPFPVLSDEPGVAYRAYGLLRGARHVLRPEALLPYLRAAARRGQRPPGRDPWQLGGDFVLDREGRVALAHPSRHPADRPPLREVLATVARHHAAVVRGTHTRLRPPYPDEGVPEAEGALTFVAEGPAGPTAVLALTWPDGQVRVLARREGWHVDLEADAVAALRRYAREELGR